MNKIFIDYGDEVLGYQRTLQATDLWKVDETRETHRLSSTLDAAWERRRLEADAWNARLLAGEIKPRILKRLHWVLLSLSAGTRYAERRSSYETRWREFDGKKEASLAWALNDTLGRFFWSAGAFKVNAFVIQPYCPEFSSRSSETRHNSWGRF